MTLFCPILDRSKSYGPAFANFARELRTREGLRVAAWDLDETTRAGLYYYADLVLPPVKTGADAVAIVAGGHPEFDAIVVYRKDNAPEPPELRGGVVLAQQRMGRRRVVRLIGAPPPGDAPIKEQLTP